MERVKEFTPGEINDTIHWLYQILDSKKILGKTVCTRMVAIAALIRICATNLLHEFVNLEDVESICDNGVRDLDLAFLCHGCSILVKVMYKTWVGSFGQFHSLHSSALQCSLFRKVLSELLQTTAVGDISATRFRKCMYGLFVFQFDRPYNCKIGTPVRKGTSS